MAGGGGPTPAEYVRWRWVQVSDALAGGAAWLLLVPVALVARLQTAVRRRLGMRPRLIWGPPPLLSIRYWSDAVKRRGYPSTTWVYGLTVLHGRNDFDVSTEGFSSPRLTYLFYYHLVMARALLKADVFCCHFEGSYLHPARLSRLEGPLLRLAGKKLVISPYGSDVMVPGYLGAFEQQILEDYPVFLETGDMIRERVDYYCRWADVVVRNWQWGYIPRADVIWPTMMAIDTDQWAERPPGDGDGHSGPVRVVHAPNHRRIKGTQALIDAVAELREEGLDVELDLLEGRPNSEVRQAMLDADIVGDQFIVGYALFAVEGMSAGKPVISPVSEMPPETLGTQAMRECPLVDCDLASLKEVLRGLVENPEERRRLGAEGRRFVERYHSLDAAGRSWEVVLDHLWKGSALPSHLPPESGLPAESGHVPEQQDA